MRGAALHPAHHGSSGLQAHGTCEALDRRFRLAEPAFYPSAENHASAKLELSTSARSIKAAAAPRSRTTNAKAHPLAASAIASSLPSSIAL